VEHRSFPRAAGPARGDLAIAFNGGMQLVPETATKVDIKPLRDQVVIEPAEQADKSAGGVILPDTVKEKSQEGNVIAIGPGKKTDKGEIIKSDLKVGDRVIYRKYSGSDVKMNGKDYVILEEKDVLATVNR
jgi:chaperonin GroES